MGKNSGRLKYIVRIWCILEDYYIFTINKHWTIYSSPGLHDKEWKMTWDWRNQHFANE